MNHRQRAEICWGHIQLPRNKGFKDMEIECIIDALIDGAADAIETTAKAEENRRYGDPGLELLFKIQDACPEAGIASGLRMGSEILLTEYLKKKETIDVRDKQFAGLLDMAHEVICKDPKACNVPCKWTHFVAEALLHLAPSNFEKASS